LVVRAAIGGTVLVAVAGLALSGHAGRALAAQALAGIDHLVAVLSAGGPWLFFGGMAVLPAVGMPMMAFSLTAGPAFAPTLGVGGTVAAALAATTVNLVLTYALARRALRPLLMRLMERLGYRLPEVETKDSIDLIVILRVTPGFPFFVQNYLLGLAKAPLGPYLGISCLVTWIYIAAFVLFGDALRRGSGKTAATAIAVIVAAVAITHMVRRHYAARKAARESVR
jgi:uncharacterized membrane protein YdjX (TVP38/TMEM64 family)